MRRYSWLLLIAAGGGCDSAADQVRRGHEMFAPCARKLAAGLLAETKARDPGGAAKLLAASDVGNEEAFLAQSTQQLLIRYGVVLSLPEERAAELRAGRFDDAGNRKRVDETLEVLRKDGAALPDVCRYTIDRIRGGDWTALDLEFAARLLWGEAMRPR